MAGATAPTINLLNNLLEDRVVEPGYAEQLRALIEKGLPQRTASTFITLLQGMPEKEPRPSEAGLYLHPRTGETCKVQISKRTGMPYAMRMRPTGKGWEYVPGLIRELRANMPADEAAAAAAPKGRAKRAGNGVEDAAAALIEAMAKGA